MPSSPFISLPVLAAAIRARCDVDPTIAEATSAQVLDRFGGDDHVLDQALSRADRRVFYMLEREGILTSRVEESTGGNGRPWRDHLWVWNVASLAAKEGAGARS